MTNIRKVEAMSKSYKLLIVDDEQAILDALEAMFLDTDLNIYTTTNPLRALEMIKEVHFHVVITDIAMPQMDGLELLKKIKSCDSFIQVIIITGYITITNALSAFRYGAADCFFKPFEDPNQIVRAVFNCIEKMDRINSFLKQIASSREGQRTVNRSEGAN